MSTVPKQEGVDLKRITGRLRTGRRNLVIRRAHVHEVQLNNSRALICIGLCDNSPVPARFLEWYIPTAGEIVWILEESPNLLILGPLYKNDNSRWEEVNTSVESEWSIDKDVKLRKEAGGIVRLRGVVTRSSGTNAKLLELTEHMTPNHILNEEQSFSVADYSTGDVYQATVETSLNPAQIDIQGVNTGTQISLDNATYHLHV